MFRKLVVAIALSTSAMLAIGTDNIVADPISYTYYVQQIDQATRMIQEAQKQVETLGGIKTVTDDVKRQLYQVRDDFVGAMDRFTAANEAFNASVMNSPDTIDKLFSTDRDSITTSPTDGGLLYKDTAEMIDKMFESSGTMPAAEFLHINDAKLRASVQKDLSQIMWKKLFSDMNASQERANARVKRVNEIMKSVGKKGDEAPTAAELQVLNANLTAELIQVQSEMLLLQKDLAVAQALQYYHGVDPNAVRDKIGILNDQDPTRREKSHESRKTQWTGEKPTFNLGEKMNF